jgi:hypothetical protein
MNRIVHRVWTISERGATIGFPTGGVVGAMLGIAGSIEEDRRMLSAPPNFAERVVGHTAYGCVGGVFGALSGLICGALLPAIVPIGIVSVAADAISTARARGRR